MSDELKLCPCCQDKGWLEKREGMQRVTGGAWYRERAYCRNKKCGLTTATFNKPGKAITAWNTRSLNHEGVRELRDCLQAMVDEQCDYMRLNNLGDPEQQHNIKRARAALEQLP